MPHSNYVRAVEVTEADLTFVRVTTNVCMVCDKMGVLDIPYLDWDYYKKNTSYFVLVVLLLTIARFITNG